MDACCKQELYQLLASTAEDVGDIVKIVEKT